MLASLICPYTMNTVLCNYRHFILLVIWANISLAGVKWFTNPFPLVGCVLSPWRMGCSPVSPVMNSVIMSISILPSSLQRRLFLHVIFPDGNNRNEIPVIFLITGVFCQITFQMGWTSSVRQAGHEDRISTTLLRALIIIFSYVKRVKWLLFSVT